QESTRARGRRAVRHAAEGVHLLVDEQAANFSRSRRYGCARRAFRNLRPRIGPVEEQPSRGSHARGDERSPIHRASFFYLSWGPTIFYCTGAPPPPLLLGASAPRNGSRLSRPTTARLRLAAMIRRASQRSGALAFGSAR